MYTGKEGQPWVGVRGRFLSRWHLNRDLKGKEPCNKKKSYFWKTKIGQRGWNIVDRETVWDAERGGQGLDCVPEGLRTHLEDQRMEQEGVWKPHALFQALPLKDSCDFLLKKDHRERRVLRLSVFEELWAVGSYQPTQYISLLVESCLGLIKILNPVYSSLIGLWFSRTAISLPK